MQGTFGIFESAATAHGEIGYIYNSYGWVAPLTAISASDSIGMRVEAIAFHATLTYPLL